MNYPISGILLFLIHLPFKALRLISWAKTPTTRNLNATMTQPPVLVAFSTHTTELWLSLCSICVATAAAASNCQAFRWRWTSINGGEPSVMRRPRIEIRTHRVHIGQIRDYQSDRWQDRKKKNGEVERRSKGEKKREGKETGGRKSRKERNQEREVRLEERRKVRKEWRIKGGRKEKLGGIWWNGRREDKRRKKLKKFGSK